MANKKKGTVNKDLEQINVQPTESFYTEIIELLKALLKNSEEVKIMLEKIKDRFV